MARQEKELSVEDRLKALYHLQTILSEVDRIKTLRGELPLEVQDLEDNLEGLRARIAKKEEEIANLADDSKHQALELERAKSMIEKYTRDLDNIRNNHEFEHISKEIEYEKLNVEMAEKRLNEDARAIDAVKMVIDESKEQIADSDHVLQEKRAELSDIMSETKQDEEKLREQAKKLEKKIEPRLLTAFKRIRKNARNGLGVVYVQRNACGGCFNRIPAQRQMEIKMHKKIIVCEYCGRILVDPALAGISEADAKNA